MTSQRGYALAVENSDCQKRCSTFHQISKFVSCDVAALAPNVDVFSVFNLFRNRVLTAEPLVPGLSWILRTSTLLPNNWSVIGAEVSVNRK